MSDSAGSAPRLDDQLCVRLYTASRLVTRAYRPVLEELGLTYPQYLVMMALWETDRLSVSELGAKLRLDSGTLTPLLKRMERAGLVNRGRTPEDERVVRVWLTEAGSALREPAACVPGQILERFPGELGELVRLRASLDHLISTLDPRE